MGLHRLWEDLPVGHYHLPRWRRRQEMWGDTHQWQALHTFGSEEKYCSRPTGWPLVTSPDSTGDSHLRGQATPTNTFYTGTERSKGKACSGHKFFQMSLTSLPIDSSYSVTNWGKGWAVLKFNSIQFNVVRINYGNESVSFARWLSSKELTYVIVGMLTKAIFPPTVHHRSLSHKWSNNGFF